MKTWVSELHFLNISILKKSRLTTPDRNCRDLFCGRIKCHPNKIHLDCVSEHMGKSFYLKRFPKDA